MPAVRESNLPHHDPEVLALLESLLAEELPKYTDTALPQSMTRPPACPKGKSLQQQGDQIDRWLWRTALLLGVPGLLLVSFWAFNGPVYDILFAPPTAQPLHRTVAAIQPITTDIESRAQQPDWPAERTPVHEMTPTAPAQPAGIGWLGRATAEPLSPAAPSLHESLVLARAYATATGPVPTPKPVGWTLLPIWITIPSIRVDSPVIDVWVENDAWRPIDYAAGYIRGTGDLGRQGNVVILGHAGLRGGVFIGLATLKPGDEVFIETPYARFRYGVRELRVVWPDQVDVFYATATPTLTLIACANWDTQRLVVTADYVDMAPLVPEGSN